MAATLTGARHSAAPLSLHALVTLTSTAALLGTALPARAQDAATSAAPVVNTAALSEILVKARRDEAGDTRNGSTTVIRSEQL